MTTGYKWNRGTGPDKREMRRLSDTMIRSVMGRQAPGFVKRHVGYERKGKR